MTPAAYEVLFHPAVEGDLRSLPSNVAARVVRAATSRLGAVPDRYGERLRQSLRGHWKLRVGDYRVVYAISGRQVRVWGVMHRRDVYERIGDRLLRPWDR